MSTLMQDAIALILKLSAEEQAQLLQLLEGRVADQTPVTDAQRQALDEALREALSDPADTISGDAVLEELWRKHGGRRAGA